jgi:hypothetical protein
MDQAGHVQELRLEAYDLQLILAGASHDMIPCPNGFLILWWRFWRSMDWLYTVLLVGIMATYIGSG